MIEVGSIVHSKSAGIGKGIRPLTVLLCGIALLAGPHEATAKSLSTLGKVCVPDTRQRVAGLVGIMTGFDIKYQERRQHARETWFPPNERAIQRVFNETGLLVRFAIGDVPQGYETQIEDEEARFGKFLRIPGKDLYNMLSFKTFEFWKVVCKRFNADYVVKIDDDNYVRLDRLAVAIRQWQYLGHEYVGCFLRRSGGSRIMKMRDHRWYDPHHEVMDGDSTYYAEGAFYAVSGRIVDGIVRSGLIPRLGGSEDIMVGWLMKAFNVSMFDDRRLCNKAKCEESMIGFTWDHAVRVHLNPDYRFPTICCKRDDVCQSEETRHIDGLRCIHIIHNDYKECLTPTLDWEQRLGTATEAKLSTAGTPLHFDADWSWIAQHSGL